MIYITGDIHGDESRLYSKQWFKLKSGDTLIICGDFGFLWDGSKKEKSVIDYLGSRKYTVCFVDGTHENYNIINNCRETIWKGGRVHRISGNLLHLMRGQIFNIDGNKIFTFGGGDSEDKDIRTEVGNWWKEELPTATQMSEGAQNLDNVKLSVDYIITHEPPSLVKSSMLLRKGQTERISIINGYLEEINRSCKFKHWYFGSLHEDRMVTSKHSSVFKNIIKLGDTN